MTVRESRVHAQAVTDAEVVEQWCGEEQSFPGVKVSVTCTPSTIDKALQMLDEHVAEVRRQLAMQGHGVVIVGGPDAQDERGDRP